MNVRQSATRTPPATEQAIWRLLETVPDPEIPAINVVELGIIRYVRIELDRIVVGVSPTYMGCPATEVIRGSIQAKLEEAGLGPVEVKPVLSPAWSSDWLTDAAREKLRGIGIAPPLHPVDDPRRLLRPAEIPCPLCASTRTERISEFASTPCKALYRCMACSEPFEYFKCI